jgi:membrane protease YdiL (CAAX protease family)
MTPPVAAIASLSATRRASLAVEGVLLFLGLPLAMRLGLVPLPRLLVLGLVAAGCFSALLADRGFERSRLVSFRGLREVRGTLAWRAAAASLVIAALVAWIEPARLLEMPRQHPMAWLSALALYPLLSAWPQELIFRAFFFHRYRSLFGGEPSLVAANALAFAALHLVYPNPVAPLLSLPAGLLLALTYRRTRSLGPVWLEHVAYGLALFTLGLGRFFYDGRG